MRAALEVMAKRITIYRIKSFQLWFGWSEGEVEPRAMHWCESKPLLDELPVHDCRQSHYSKICGQMYNRLQREHILLQRSLVTVYQTLNETLLKNQSIEQHLSNVPQTDDLDSKKYISSLNDIDGTSGRTGHNYKSRSIPEFIYKKLCKEHVILQRSFSSVCRSLKEVLDASQRPVNNGQKKDSDELKRRIELLTLELQESRDQNELLEFRVHELEHNKEMVCNKCLKLESQLESLEQQLLEANNEKKNLYDKYNTSKSVLNDLIAKYGLNQELDSLLLRTASAADGQCNRYSGSSLASVMTSEDEGLGEDTRRDLSSGPSSLADLQECEFDAISERSSTEESHTHLELSKKTSQQTESTQIEKNRLLLEVNRQRDVIDKLEQSLQQLKAEKESLVEQVHELKENVLELEEAENDSRLMSQRLERQLNAFSDQYEKDLIAANKTIDLNNNRIKNFETIEAEIRLQVHEIKSILMKHSLIDSDCDTKFNTLLDTKSDVSLSDDNKYQPKKWSEVEPPINSLYTFLWEKLYRIETQIDCLQQSYCHTNDSLSHESDDDLQLFISAENFSEDISRIGSSFDVKHFDNRFSQSKCIDNHLQTSTPLCDTIKPEKIDITWPSKTGSTSLHGFPPEITDLIYKLETNEKNLKQRLLQLEWINKQFVRELEVREKLLFERERNRKEYIENALCLRREIEKVKDQMQLLTHQKQQIEANDANEAKTDQTIGQLNHYKNVENIITNLENEIKKLKIQTKSIETEMKPKERIRKGIESEGNFEIIGNAIKTLKNFVTEKLTLGESYESSERWSQCCNCGQNIRQTSIKNRRKQALDLREEEERLKNLLDNKEDEWKQVQRTYEETINSLSEEHKRIESELRSRMQEMESQTSVTVNDMETERRHLYSCILRSFRDNELGYRKSINELNENVDKIESKMSNLCRHETQGDKVSDSRVDSSSAQPSEDELRKKLNEMMAKESAYEETLSKADKIIASLEHNYRQRIGELEASEASLRARITQLEDNEVRLRTCHRSDRRGSDSFGKASDLVEQLIECRDREQSLNQQIKSLESSVTRLEAELEASSQTRDRIESELKDQDDLLHTVHQLQQQNEALKTDLNKSLQSQDSLQEMLRETEGYYQKRDEEMQSKYKSLEDEKCSLELNLRQLDRRLRQNHVSDQSVPLASVYQCESALKTTNNKETEEKTKENGIKSNDCDVESNSLKKELDQTMVDMEMCLKRAMAVVKLEINQKSCESISDVTNSLPNSLPNLDEIVKPIPPKKLEIKKVHCDSLLVGWQSIGSEHIAGYQILVNDVIIKRLQNPRTRKVLVNNLDLTKSFEMKIKSISNCGQTSDPISVEFQPIYWTSGLQSPESTDYCSDCSDSSDAGADQMTRL